MSSLNQVIEELRAQIESLTRELAACEASFRLRQDADQRAVRRWQKVTGRKDVWPCHADLCFFLMEELEELLNTKKHQNKPPGPYKTVSGLEKENRELKQQVNYLSYLNSSAEAWAAACQELENEREELLTRVKAILPWIPQKDPNRKWLENMT